MLIPDFTIREFTAILQTCEPHLPISDAFEEADPQKQGRWWSSQKEHMVVWFASQNSLGSGGFTRNTANDSARTTYQRLQTAEGLLWIAEALGADTALVKSASAKALSNPRRNRPRIIRQYIPWETIASLARARK
jgi:hypothetical protein